jgi:hypothetical protein
MPKLCTIPSGSVLESGCIEPPAWQPTHTSMTPIERMAQYVLQR